MLPRGDVLLLGGIFKTGDASRHVETDETERMVEEHRKLYERFG